MRCFKIPVYNTTFYYKVSFWRSLFSKTIYVQNHSFFWCLINSSSFRISSFFMTIRKLLFHQAFSLFGPILFDRDCSVLHFSTPLREKCSNTEFALVRIFPHLDWIRRDTEYLSVFSPNAGKYRPAKTPYLDNFHAVLTLSTHVFLKMNRLGIHFFYRKKWSFLAKDISTNYNTFYFFKKFLCQDQAIKLKGESCE